MSETFVRTESGALNLRYVRRIYQGKHANGLTSHTAVTEEGREYPIELGTEALDHLCLRIVPASPNDRACFLAVDADNLTLEGVDEQHVKIVAWGISVNYGGGCYGVEPIYAEKPASNQTSLISCPDGSWQLQEDATFRTLDAAKAEVLARHQQARRG